LPTTYSFTFLNMDFQILYSCFVLSLPEYNPEGCRVYKLFQSYDSMLTTGPDLKAGLPAQDTLSDEDSTEEEHSQEDHYALLVKAWEQKVFPVIRRRFRNEAERKDGLEQIKGALQLGEFSGLFTSFFAFYFTFFLRNDVCADVFEICICHGNQ